MGEREKEKERDNVAGAGVVTQLVERLLPTPEVRGSNPVIVKFDIFFLSTVLKRRK